MKIHRGREKKNRNNYNDGNNADMIEKYHISIIIYSNRKGKGGRLTLQSVIWDSERSMIPIMTISNKKTESMVVVLEYIQLWTKIKREGLQ